MSDAPTGQTVELLQQMIRNQCVNDGTVSSGQEVRTCDLLRTYLQGSGLDVEVYEPVAAPGRASCRSGVMSSRIQNPRPCVATTRSSPWTMRSRTDECGSLME